MRDIESFSIHRNCDKETFKRFDLTRHLMKMKKSEGIIKALSEFNINHPIDKINPLENYMDDIKKPIMPMFSPHTNLKEIKSISNKMSNDELIQMKTIVKKILSIMEVEIESRIDG